MEATLWICVVVVSRENGKAEMGATEDANDTCGNGLDVC